MYFSTEASRAFASANRVLSDDCQRVAWLRRRSYQTPAVLPKEASRTTHRKR